MPETFDWLYLILFAVAWPLVDHFVVWRLYQHHVKTNAPLARRWFWVVTICEQWVLVALGVIGWLAYERPWSWLGLTSPEGWRLWVSGGLILTLAAFQIQALLAVARSADQRAIVRGKVQALAEMLPHTRGDLAVFVLLSLTAGCCEEFLFRGFFVWVLTPWFGWWGAAFVATVLFGLLHAYQGLDGIIRSGIVGALLVLVVAWTESLYPAMVLHALVDLGSGTMAWLVLRDRMAEVPPSTSLTDG